MRIDKWLWAARFFKTRALAGRACELGRVLLGGQTTKPARELRPGDRLRVTTEGGIYEVDVIALSEVRGPAAVARELYRETEEGRIARERETAERRALYAAAPVAPAGRPSKRDRRKIIRFRDFQG